MNSNCFYINTHQPCRYGSDILRRKLGIKGASIVGVPADTRIIAESLDSKSKLAHLEKLQETTFEDEREPGQYRAAFVSGVVDVSSAPELANFVVQTNLRADPTPIQSACQAFDSQLCYQQQPIASGPRATTATSKMHAGPTYVGSQPEADVMCSKQRLGAAHGEGLRQMKLTAGKSTVQHACSATLLVDIC